MQLPAVSDRFLRGSAVFYTLIMAFVVASGWIPGWYSWAQTGERMSFHLFMLSPLDDITHGLTALAFLAAAIGGRTSYVRLAATAFGWYYALDAIFFLAYGFVNQKPWMADIMLNLPHVVLSSLLLWLAYAPPRLAAAPAPGLARQT